MILLLLIVIVNGKIDCHMPVVGDVADDLTCLRHLMIKYSRFQEFLIMSNSFADMIIIPATYGINCYIVMPQDYCYAGFWGEFMSATCDRSTVSIFRDAYQQIIGLLRYLRNTNYPMQYHDSLLKTLKHDTIGVTTALSAVTRKQIVDSVTYIEAAYQDFLDTICWNNCNQTMIAAARKEFITFWK